MKRLINTQKKRNGLLAFSIVASLVVFGISASAFMPTVENTKNEETENAEVLTHTAQNYIYIYGADGDGQVNWRYPVNHSTETEEEVFVDFEDGTALEIAQEIAAGLNIDLDINIIADAYSSGPNTAYVCIQEKRTGSQHEGNRANLGNMDGNLTYYITSVLLGDEDTCP